jgi:cell division protein FtsB
VTDWSDGSGPLDGFDPSSNGSSPVVAPLRPVPDHTGAHRSSTIPRPRVPGEPSRANPRPPSGPLIRPEPGDDTRLVLRRRNRRMLGVGGALIAISLAAAVLVLPVRAWLDQRSELAERKRQLAALEQANSDIEAQNQQLGSAEGVETAARDELGYVRAGETITPVLPLPAAPAQFPDGWPYTAVVGIVSARTKAAAAAAAAENPATTTPATTATTRPATTAATATTKAVTATTRAAGAPAATPTATTQPASATTRAAATTSPTPTTQPPPLP